MITLDEACASILSKYPSEYIHNINEYDEVYQFFMMNNNEVITDTTFFCTTPIVDKKTGGIIEDVCIVDDIVQGDYKRVAIPKTY